METNNINRLWACIATLALSLGIIAAAQRNCNRDSYPQRLISEFPVIYSDTVKSTPRYKVVARAVWGRLHHRKTKVKHPTEVCTSDCKEVVRFAPGCMLCHEKIMFQTDETVSHKK